MRQVNDDHDQTLMDLSMEMGDELSKDSEGFSKYRTHQNKAGITVPDTPAHDGVVIVVEDDLGSEPEVSLEEEEVIVMSKVLAMVGPSEPVTLVASTQPSKEITGGVGPSEPVTPIVPVKGAQVIAGGGGLSAPMIPPAKHQQVESVDRGCPSAHVILSAAATGPGVTMVGAGAGAVLRPTSAHPPGSGPETAGKETTT